MNFTPTLLITGALLISQASAQDQQAQPKPQSAPAQRIEDQPDFKALTSEQQKQILALPDDITRWTVYLAVTKKIPVGPAPVVDYSYHGQNTDAAKPVPPPPPARATITVPCAPAKPLTFKDRLKLRLEMTLAQQAQKADAAIAKGTKGQVNGGATDATVAAIQQANQPKPCVVQGPANQ